MLADEASSGMVVMKWLYGLYYALHSVLVYILLHLTTQLDVVRKQNLRWFVVLMCSSNKMNIQHDIFVHFCKVAFSLVSAVV